MTIDEAIAHALEVAEKNECKMTSDDGYTDVSMKRCAAEHRQLAEWLMELKDLREENKVLTSECDRLIKEKGELLKKSAQIAEYKRLLKLAVEDFKEINSDILTCKYCRWYSEEIDECTYYPEDTPCEQICGWKHEVEALKLIGEDEDGKI